MIFFYSVKEDGFILTSLSLAASRGHHQICQLLLDSGAVVDMPEETMVANHVIEYHHAGVNCH